MTWFGWLLVAMFALSAVTVVGTVGKSRKPLDTTTAACTMLIYVAEIVLLLRVGTGHL